MATTSQLIFKMLKKNATLILLLFSVFKVAAQQYYPVVARFTQLPPYPVYLADFSNPAQTNLSIQVQQNDRTIEARPIRIRIYIKGNGFQIQSTEMVQDEPPLTLNYGQIYNLPAQQVANYFKQYNLQVSPDQYRQPFNEGAFQFGVEIIDVQTSKPISGVQWANPVWLTVNEPPVWVQPKNEITEKINTLQNINFQWAARHNSISNVEYEFSMTELITTNGGVGNIQNLFLAQPTFYKVRTQGTVLNYNATLPPLVAGRAYAYRVQAIAKRGHEEVGVFRNNGFSEVQYVNYGEKLLPPTNLKITWSENNNREAILNWKAEEKHKAFTVEIREKNAKTDWIATETKPQNTGVYNAFTFSQLDPFKSYEARVTGIGEDNQKAVSTITELKLSPVPLKQEELLLKGNVLWAYRSSEENVTDNTPLSLTADGTIRKRQTKHESFANQTAGTQKYALEGAIVTLYSAEEEITIANYKTKTLKRIETVSTNANGEYTLKGQNVQLLAEVKYLYAIAEYQGAVFSPALMKVQLASNASGTKTLGELIVLANNIRFTPQVVASTKESALSTDNIEEIALYRLKNSLDKNPYLKQEGNVKGEKPTLLFNNDTYVKVADFGKTSTVAQLFYNKAYNDKFVFRVKQKDRKAVIFPVNDIDDFKDGNYAQITDFFNYTAPNHVISGYVETKGGKTERLANVSVRVLGQSVRTNDKGYFELDIPQNTAKNTKISLSAVDPLNTNNTTSDTLVYQAKDEEKTLVINRNAYYVEGRVYLRDGSAVSGATVELQGQSSKTSAEGYFSLVRVGEMKDSVKVSFDAYEVSYVPVDKFKKKAMAGVTMDAVKESFIKEVKARMPNREQFFEENFVQTKNALTAFYTTDSVVLHHETTIRIITYINNIGVSGLRNTEDSSHVIEAVIKIDDNEQVVKKGQLVQRNGKPTWTGGYVGKVTKGELVIKVINKRILANDTTSIPTYVEEEITLPLPKKYAKKDTVLVKIRLKPAMYFYGTVYDSTTYIKGVHLESDKSVRKPGDSFNAIDSVEVSVSGSKGLTNKNGQFKVLVPKGEDFELEASKTGFATSKYAFTATQAQLHNSPNPLEKRRKDLYLVRQDKGIPKFTTLMGFDIKVDKATKQSGDAYLVSGVLYLDKGKLEKGKQTNIFSATGSTKELNFRNLVVKQDAKKKENAITVMTSINFVETEAKIMLFGYAPITLQGNPIGEPYIRLQHLDVKAGKASEGKIGASEMEFTQREMMGVNFGKMELKVKDPDKETKFGKTDDKVSDKDASKRETQRKEDDALTSKMQIQNQKNAVETAKGDAKKAEEKALVDLEGKKYTAVPEKEPLLLAFAPVNLEELAESKEYRIEFPQAAKKDEIKNITAPKEVKKDYEEPKKNDKYANFVRIPVGTVPVVGLASVMAGINPNEAVLKKSGISMKGVLLLPQIWAFKMDSPALTIEKLEIDKKFEMKTAIIGKADTTKPEIVRFGMADKFMCYWKTVQLYNNFKGFGVGGTINTDKENFININSLGLSVVDGRVYPNVDLSTPKDGFKISKLRFKTVGKKSITIKGNPDDKSYEIEGSLRIEYDDKEAKNLATDEKDRFGHDLSPEKIMEKKNKELEKEQEEINNRKKTKEEEIKNKALKLQGEEQRKKKEEELKALEENLTTAETIERRKRLRMEDTDDLKKDLEVKRAAIETLKKQIEDDKAAVAKAEKEKNDELAKAEKEKKDEAEKAANKKIAAEKKDVEAKTAIENGQQREVETKDAKSKGLIERVFPIEVQLFKWSTTGKFIVSAAPSPDALSFGPVAIKIRRIVFAKGVAATATQPASPVKESEIQDLLKMSDDEMKKLNTSKKFNDANTYIDKEGQRSGATSEASQTTKEGAAIDNLSVKAIEDKVALDNPITTAWAMGFAGGVEVETKSVNIDSDASFYVGDFDGKGIVFKMNEFMLKVDAPSFKAYAKVKIGTTGKKIGAEGEGTFEGATLKAAMSLKFYKLFDEKGEGTGVELGAALKVSLGTAGMPMGPITWTALGGGFDLNTADKKFAVFLLGDARTTGLPEKVTNYKKIRLAVEYDGKAVCSTGVPIVIRGSMEVWSGMMGETPEKICDVTADIDMCRVMVVCKIDCEIKVSDKKVKIDGLAFVSKSAGFFLGATVRAEVLGMNVNGIAVLGIMCDTQDEAAPKELGAYVKGLPKYLYQNDNRTISAIYLGVDVAYELKKNGGVSAFGIDLITYSAEIIAKGRLHAGVNFSNGNFMINSSLKMEAEGKASILAFNMGGKLELALELGGGRTNELGWNFRAFAQGKLELGAGNYANEACNDFSITGIKWCTKCITCCNGTSWRCWARIDVPYPCGGKDRFMKLCLDGQMGVYYQEKGASEVRGWRAQLGGNAPGSNAGGSRFSAASAITADLALSLGESKVSPNGVYKVTLQKEDGNVVITKEGVKIWETRTTGIESFKVQKDGNLVAYAKGETAKWASNTNGKGDESTTLVMQDDGNLVLYKNGDNAFWSSGTKNVFTEAEVTNKSLIRAENKLSVGQSLTSSNGKYKVAIDTDGNITLRKENGKAIWATSTGGKDIDAFKVQNDGNLVAYRRGNNAEWASQTNGKGNRSTVLIIQNDGNLVLYKSLEEITPGYVKVYRGRDAIWGSGTDGGLSQREKENPFPAGSSLVTESVLSPNESKSSPNGVYKLILQTDGNVVLTKKGIKIWETNTTGVDAFKVQNDGNLVAYANGGAKWASQTNGKGDGSTVLVVQDDGNMVLYKKNKESIWASGTGNVFTEDEVKKSTLKVDQPLNPNESIVSANGKYKVMLESDGNVVLRDDMSKVLWATDTDDMNVNVFKAQKDGNLVAYLQNGTAVWASGTNGKAADKATLFLQDDGSLILYKEQESVQSGNIMLYRFKDQIWASNTSGRVAPKTIENPFLPESSIEAKSMIKLNQSKNSPNRIYKLLLSQEGNLVLTKKGVKIWETNTGGKGVEVLKVEKDGNLVAYDSKGAKVWTSGTAQRGDRTTILALQDDGNLVLYKNGKEPIWSSGTNDLLTENEVAMSTIRAENMLRPNQSISSPNGTYKVTLQPDGNVVLYKGTAALWATGTNGKDVDAFKVQNDGNIVAYIKGGIPTWSSLTNGKSGNETVLMMQDDGNLILYKSLERLNSSNINTPVYRAKEVIWSTLTKGK